MKIAGGSCALRLRHVWRPRRIGARWGTMQGAWLAWTFPCLMARGGLYADLYRLQFQDGKTVAAARPAAIEEKPAPLDDLAQVRLGAPGVGEFLHDPLGPFLLLVVVVEDRRAVLGSEVIALPVRGE